MRIKIGDLVRMKMSYDNRPMGLVTRLKDVHGSRQVGIRWCFPLGLKALEWEPETWLEIVGA
tara:strand:+ start:1899 stop:2084 length:186 start_codon:yes stop_codon:yes gene_type:complete